VSSDFYSLRPLASTTKASRGTPRSRLCARKTLIPPPRTGYGWEKLFAEELCRYYYQDFGFEIRIVRFHNVYGPLGTYDGGKEKAGPRPSPESGSVAQDNGEIEVWGDGEQTRSFMYVDDCVEGLIRIMVSDYREPLNLGSNELVSINELVEIVSSIAGKHLTKRHNLGGPQGVRGRTAIMLAYSTYWMETPQSVGTRTNSDL